jgi:glycosyltransferase involved in cell wall biosynthesis
MAGSGVSEMSFAGKFDAAHREFNKKWGAEYDKKLSLPVLYHTSIGLPSGFAQAARGYIKGLTENGVKVSYNYLRGTNEEEDESEDDVVNSICENHGNFKMPQVVWAQAPYFNKNSGIYKIGHCEFEGEWVPAEWADSCNTMDELWVPTNWDREKFRRAGVNVPIYTFAQGIDKNYFHPDISPMRFEAPETFKFICNAAFDPRKNIPGLISAFKNEFKKTEDVCLIVKTMNLGLTQSVSDEIKKIKYAKESAQVYVKEERFKPYELGSFYTAGDCFVLPTRGEAWGLPLLEALACGIPVITTGWGAPDEILRDDSGNPYPGVKFIRCQKSITDTPYVYLQGNYWAEPSTPHLQKLMRESFENRDKEKKEAMKTSQIIREKFDWVEITKPIKDRLQVIYREKMA